MNPQPNLSSEIEIEFGDGKYVFALRLKEIEELQRLCGAGLGEIANRVMLTQSWYVKDIYETIRLGLIGGGMPAVRAREIIEVYVDGRPIASSGDPSSPLLTARAVLMAVYFGVREAVKEANLDDDEGKSKAGMAGTSPSRPSTGSGSPSTYPQAKSESSASVNGYQPSSSMSDSSGRERDEKSEP